MLIEYDDVLKMLDKLRYNIQDGMSMDGIKRTFEAEEYVVADAALKTFLHRLEKKYGNGEPLLGK